jgi:hypothetical protein
MVSLAAPGCVAYIYSPPTRTGLEQSARLAREHQDRFDQVYDNPNAYSRAERNRAWMNLPAVPVPKDCLPPGSESKPECIRYAAGLRALIFQMSQLAY